MSKSNPIRIMVVEDHTIVREGLELIISAQPEMDLVAQTGDGLQAVELFRQHQPDITLIDLRIPGISGVETIIAIRNEFPHSRFVVLTTYEGDEDIYRALEAGAQAYLLKGMSRTVLLEAIKAVHNGLRYFHPIVTETLATHQRTRPLSARELEILKLLIKGKGNKEIGAQLSITEGTAKWYVSNILSALGAADRTQAVTIALQRGIVHFE